MPIINRLHNLPQNITTNEIGNYLTNEDKTTFTETSSRSFGLFQPERLQKMADKLLLHVMRGEQNKAEQILKMRPELLNIEGLATDYSGRTFNTTPFLFALWALDTRYMCNMMLDCVFNSTNSEAIKQELLTQFQEYEQNGVSYMQKNHIINEMHYEFSNIFIAFQIYLENYEQWTAHNVISDDLLIHWSSVIGAVQLNIPVHVAQHYCDPDTSFSSKNQFNKKRFNRSLEFYNPNTDRKELWFNKTDYRSGLGEIFGIIRENDFGFVMEHIRHALIGRGSSAVACNGATADGAADNLAALIVLFRKRESDLITLKMRLESSIQNQNESHQSCCVIA